MDKRVVGRAEKQTWQYVWTAGQIAFRAAVDNCEDPDGSHDTAPGIYALLCTTMGFEGFVHWVGTQVCPDHWWASVERSSVKRKLELISRERSIEIDFGAEPFSSWKRIKAFRDAVAHPRVEMASAEFYADEDNWPLRLSEEILLPWEEECSMPQLGENMRALEAMRRAVVEKTGVRIGAMASGSGIEQGN